MGTATQVARTAVVGRVRYSAVVSLSQVEGATRYFGTVIQGISLFRARLYRDQHCCSTTYCCSTYFVCTYIRGFPENYDAGLQGALHVLSPPFPHLSSLNIKPNPDRKKKEVCRRLERGRGTVCSSGTFGSDCLSVSPPVCVHFPARCQKSEFWTLLYSVVTPPCPRAGGSKFAFFSEIAVKPILGNTHLFKLRVNNPVARVLPRGISSNGACGSVTPLGDSARVNRTIRYIMCTKLYETTQASWHFEGFIRVFVCTSTCAACRGDALHDGPSDTLFEFASFRGHRVGLIF